MSRLEQLRQERNILVDAWTSKPDDEKVRILVKIMDLEDDINQLLSTLKNQTRGTLVS